MDGGALDVAEGAGLDPRWAPALWAWWLSSCQPRQRRWLLNSCCNCALGGKIRVWVTSGWGLAVQQLPVPNLPPQETTSVHKAHCSVWMAFYLFLLSVLAAFGQNLLEGAKERHKYIKPFQKQFLEKSGVSILEYLELCKFFCATLSNLRDWEEALPKIAASQIKQFYLECGFLTVNCRINLFSCWYIEIKHLTLSAVSVCSSA